MEPMWMHCTTFVTVCTVLVVHDQKEKVKCWQVMSPPSSHPWTLHCLQTIQQLITPFAITIAFAYAHCTYGIAQDGIAV